MLKCKLKRARSCQNLLQEPGIIDFSPTCSPDAQEGLKHGTGSPDFFPLAIPQALLYAPVSLDICPESEDV